MMHRNDHTGAPQAEQLAAYVDGELSGAERALIEEWLTGHPDARAEVAAYRRLRQLSHASAPTEPSEEAWRALLTRVETRLSEPRRRAAGVWQEVTGWAGRKRRLAGVAAALTLTAATLLLALLWQRSPHEPWPVATADEVEIISVDAADAGLLVVGDLPLRGPLVLAAPGDVVLERLEPEQPGKEWRARTEPEDPAPPMIVAPLVRGPDRRH